jgi:hypothetical protein
MSGETPRAETYRIHPEWDAALTYEALERAAATGVTEPRPVFVGRRGLLDLITGTIRQPDRRGTFLVSGYRGAGKTTLLIESICRAAGELPERWTLLPLVLNASEVSASLGPAAAAPTLQIGPQQLLAALIRTLRNFVDSPRGATCNLTDEVLNGVRDAYRKASAKEYIRSESDQRQQTETRSQESEIKLSAADVYKALSGTSAIAALGLQGSAWFGGASGAIHALSIALAGVAALSGAQSWKLSRSVKQEQVNAVSVKYDGSIQQLESDLKDVLARLHGLNFRTVVVLEELDKLRDDDGKQLDNVIRYFKNLFTQAPALFFFVTDKAYYDFIAAEIRQARRRRSYAVEHTFFTHRLFVGRPTTRECLEYFQSILLDPAASERLSALYEAPALQPFSADIAEDPLLRLVRYLLFRASNHLFDLKNELRRFVRTQGNDLVIDTGLLTKDEAAIGGFLDLVFEKVRSFAIGDGRSYANEVLNDCLYGVFVDQGSDTEQRVADFYPRSLVVPLAAAPPAPPPAGPGVAGASPPAPAERGSARKADEDQLELFEQQQIRTAVDSLIADLQRGEAFETPQTNITEGRFVWKRAAARAFRFRRELEDHERTLWSRLERVRGAVAVLGGQGLLGPHVDAQEPATAFVGRVEQRLKAVQAATRAVPVNEAEAEGLAVQREAAMLLDRAYRAHLNRVVEPHGLTVTGLGQSEGGSLSLLATPLGDPRERGSQSGGAVLIAQGEGGRLDDDARAFVAASQTLQRLAIIHVVHAPGEPRIATALVDKWRSDLANELGRAIPRVAGSRALEVDVVPLDEGWTADDVGTHWGERLLGRILLRATWAALAITADWPLADLSGLLATPESQSGPEPFTDALKRWLAGQQRLLHIRLVGGVPPDTGPFIAACVEAMRGLDTIGSALAMPVEAHAGLDPLRRQLFRMAGGRSDKETLVAAAVAGLLGQRALIPIVYTADALHPGELSSIVGDGGRAILITPAAVSPSGADAHLSLLTLEMASPSA